MKPNNELIQTNRIIKPHLSTRLVQTTTKNVERAVAIDFIKRSRQKRTKQHSVKITHNDNAYSSLKRKSEIIQLIVLKSVKTLIYELSNNLYQANICLSSLF